MKVNPKLVRITTVPISLRILLKGQISYLNNNGFDIIMISSKDDKLNELISQERCAFVEVPMKRRFSPLFDIFSLVIMTKILFNLKPNIVHTHTPKAGLIGMLASKFIGIPHRLHTVAGLPLLEAKGIKREILKFVEKITYACATHVYPNSFGLRDIIVRQQFCKPTKLSILANGSSNGIDTDYFNPATFSSMQKQKFKKKMGISSSSFVFIFVGRLVSDKGINELINSFKKVQLLKENRIATNSDSKQEFKLLLVGSLESELDPLFKDTLFEIDNNPDILSIGFKDDIRPYLAISDCLVFPSYREGFPNTVMQAGAMGLPSIVTDINGCNEIIFEGINGTLVPPKNVCALIDAMLKMHSDEVWRNKLKSNARRMITNRYKQQVVWDALLAEYNSLLL